MRTAAALHIVLGLGFGAASIPTLLHFAARGELPMSPFGFRSLSGPFEVFGPGVFLVLGWSFVAACAADVLAGIWLWRGRRRGLVLGLALDPPMLVFASGFALPILLLALPVRAALAIAARKDVR